jgi:hypothetical protein
MHETAEPRSPQNGRNERVTAEHNEYRTIAAYPSQKYPVPSQLSLPDHRTPLQLRRPLQSHNRYVPVE